MKWRIKGALIVWTKLVNSNIPHICNLIITICRTPEFDFWVRKIPCGREWQPTPVFLLENLHGQRSLAGYSPWGHRESDTTERLSSTQCVYICVCVCVCVSSLYISSLYILWGQNFWEWKIEVISRRMENTEGMLENNSKDPIGLGYWLCEQAHYRVKLHMWLSLIIVEI